jgi:hypothetical protein
VHEGLEIILASDREHSDDYEYEWWSSRAWAVCVCSQGMFQR